MAFGLHSKFKLPVRQASFLNQLPDAKLAGQALESNRQGLNFRKGELNENTERNNKEDSRSWYGRWREDALVDGQVKRVQKFEKLAEVDDLPADAYCCSKIGVIY